MNRPRKGAAQRQRLWPLVLLVAVLAFLACSEETTAPEPTPSTPDAVYNDDGGFVITKKMLDMPYNKITFPGTHNSFAGASWDALCENQDLTIAQQLAAGIRYIEFDLNGALYVVHGACYGYFNERLEQVRDYARDHPNQIITARISDISGMSAYQSFYRVNERLEELGLDKYIYNWDPTKARTDWRRCYMPDPWPTLREMIDSGRNVMFIHNRASHPFVDEGRTRGLAYSDANHYPFYSASVAEQFSRTMPLWSPGEDRQADGPERLFLAEVCPDGGASAGSKEAASKNNDGRKLYQLAKQHETEILPDKRCVNFINVDYFGSSHAHTLPVNVVDACNRLNYERIGSSWKSAECFWELYPYEFDRSKTEYIGASASIADEVAAAVDDHVHHVDLDGHEDKGRVVSTTYATEHDWKRIPEWAVDNDYFTRWCGSSSGDNHTWGIDIGTKRPATEIAIAWEYAHKMPAYTVFGSNHVSFEDGMSNDELMSDTNWEVLAQGPMLTNIPATLWDVAALDQTGSGGWRYFKIKVTNADSSHWPSIREVKIYGP